MNEKTAAVLGLACASLIFAIAGVSYKWLLAIGFSFLSFFWITRLAKLVTAYFITKILGIRHPVIVDQKELIFLYLNGFFSIMAPIFFVLSLSYIKLSNTYFLSYTMPAWTLIFAVAFLGEKLSPKKLLAVMLTLLGIIFISRPDDLLNFNMGFIFGILAAFSHAGDIITSRELKDYDPQTVSLYSNFFQFIIFTLAFVLLFNLPNASALAALPFVIIIGVLLGIGSTFYYYALHYIEASKAGIISLLELLFALLLGAMLFSELPSFSEVLGYGMIISAAVLVILRKSMLPNFERLIYFKRKY